MNDSLRAKPVRSTGRRRSLACLLTAAIALISAAAIGPASAAAGTGTASPAITVQPDTGSSTAGGPITRAEIQARAQDWVNERVPYSESADWTDSNGTYRQDCSGFISMAWHLVSDSADNHGETTWTLPDFSTKLSSLDDLQPGDMIDNISTHVVLFLGWTSSSHTTAIVAEEAHTGTVAHVDSSYYTRSFLLNNGYEPFRYNNVVEYPSKMGEITDVGDQNSDGVDDFIAVERSSGFLYLYYSPNYSGTDRLKLGWGWNTMRDIAAIGDHNGDGKDDIIAVDTSDGHMYMYLGPDFSGTTRVDLGAGWGGYTDIAAVGDHNGDGLPDFVATDTSTGYLYLYTSPNYYGSERQKMGTSWTGMRDITDVGDHNGDGKDDFVAVNTSDNHMYLYYGPDYSGTTRVDLGAGWGGYTDIAGIGDHNSDKQPDFVATDTSTDYLYLYSSPNYLGSQRQKIGTGW